MTAIDKRTPPRMVHLRAGVMEQVIFRANRSELARAKATLGYKSVQDMVVDLVERSVEDKVLRERRVRAQRQALRLLNNIDLSDLARITTFRP